MGKRIISQRRGRKSPVYASPGHRFVTKVSYPITEKITKVKVKAIIHDPARSAPLMVLALGDRDCCLPAPLNVKVGDELVIGTKKQSRAGNIMALKDVPLGESVSNIELKPLDGGKICRSSGTFARVVEKNDAGVTVRLPSKKNKILNPNCRVTVGIIAGGGRPEKPFVKAGKKYHIMRARNKLYPKTSAVSMNAVDHPFGSGRGSHMGKPGTPPRFAPPGRKVGQIRARKMGRGGKK
ncbi:50S ribosomal protein L2 [archaeon]|nr:50S ribosomal protein L2 [archaeon]